VPALSPRHQALGDALRALRNERGLSQESLGERAGISGNYVGDTERGERNVTVRILWALADALDTDAATLLRRAQDSGTP
jgi:transcriptional regulator with XRE-family HTH domain